MSENVTPAQIEAIMRNVVAEENYSIARTFYQIRKKNYIINCDFIQDVLGPMMRSPKRTRTDADIKVAVLSWYRNRRIEHPRLGQSRYSCCS